MARVLSMLSTSFWLVPDRSLVEPAMNSGPTTTSIAMSAAAPTADPALFVNPIRSAPRRPASARAPNTYGVRPELAIPTTVSASPTPSSAIAHAPPSTSSSAFSTARWIATSPPAMTPTTRLGSVPYVGGISLASSTPIRPAVPAPI
jgi:hypothetical protein